jgi:P2 family phage contractile tail tube protein
MAASVIIWEAANLYAGDNGPNNSKHLTLQSIQLPQLKEKHEAHLPGGAVGAISIGMMSLESLEVSFKLTGSDSQTKAQFGLGSTGSQFYTIYGVLRDKNGGRAIERKAIVKGRLVECGEAEFSRGKLTTQDHKIAEITHYELYEDKAEVYYYDFFSSIWRVSGADQRADVNAILRI